MNFELKFDWKKNNIVNPVAISVKKCNEPEIDIFTKSFSPNWNVFQVTPSLCRIIAKIYLPQTWGPQKSSLISCLIENKEIDLQHLVYLAEVVTPFISPQNSTNMQIQYFFPPSKYN